MQYGPAPVDHQSVAGIVPALEAHYALRVISEPVDDLALTFVAPLRADDHHVPCHRCQRLRFEVQLRGSTRQCEPRRTRRRSHASSARVAACPGRSITTTSPAARSSSIAWHSAASPGAYGASTPCSGALAA